MKVELNIGLLVNDGDNSQDAQDDRQLVALDILQACSDTLHARVDTAGEEPTLVAEIDVSFGRADKIAYLLAQALDQIAVAWYAPAIAFGALSGPRAALWGDFDLSRFVRT